MKRFKGNKINKPLVLMLFGILAINNGWLTAQTEVTASEYASEGKKEKNEPMYVFNEGKKRLVVERGPDDPHATPRQNDDDPIVFKPVPKEGQPSNQGGQPGTVTEKGRTETERRKEGDKVVTETSESLVLTKKELKPMSVQVPIEAANGSYEITITTKCTEYKGMINKRRCKVSAKPPSETERKSLKRSYGVEEGDDADKKLDDCKCLEKDLELSVSEFREFEATEDWWNDIAQVFKRKYADKIDEAKGKKKKLAKGEKDESRKKVQAKIDECELSPESTDENPIKLKEDEKWQCIQDAVERLGDADKDTKEGKAKIALLNKLVGKAKNHLKKCLANEDKREDAGCLDLAEAIRDATADNDNDGVHRISHQMDIMIAQGHSSIENTKVMEQLKGLRSGMANANLVAQRTGNMGPMMMYQQRLGQLHQYFLASQMRREQYLRNWELDPEMGMSSMGDINNDYMLMSRIEEEFQNTAMPNRFGGMNGMNGMNRMMGPYGQSRFGMPPYGPMGPQLGYNPMMHPGVNPMMNPMMMVQMGMRPPMMPYNPMMPMANGPYMPGMMPGMPGMMPGMPGMMPPYAMMNRPPMMPYGPQFGFQFGINGGFNGGMPMGSYGNWPMGGNIGPGLGGMPFAGPGPTAGYFPPNMYQSALPVPTTVNPR